MSTPRNALGRGLGALIPPRPSRDASVTEEGLPEGEGLSVPRGIPVDLIDPNPEQPRRALDPASLDELADSIQRHGVLQPVVVRRAGERFEVIVGERRWRAGRAAGLQTIPAVVADVAPQERLELAIVENVQRQDLNPIELAYAYQALADAGATQEEIGRKVSKDRSSVANHLRLLELSRDIQQDLEDGHITMGHAKALLQVSNPERRRHLRDRVLRDRLSVRETEELGREMAGSALRHKSRSPTSPAEPLLRDLVEALEQQLQTRVRIKGSANRGRVEIAYSSSEDLDRVASLILKGAEHGRFDSR